jgi:hypothetical protein
MVDGFALTSPLLPPVSLYAPRPRLQVGNDVYDAHSEQPFKMHTMLLRPLVDSRFVTAVTGMYEPGKQVGLCNSCAFEGKSVQVGHLPTSQNTSVHKVCYLDVWKLLPSDDAETIALRDACCALYNLQTGGEHSSSGVVRRACRVFLHP